MRRPPGGRGLPEGQPEPLPEYQGFAVVSESAPLQVGRGPVVRRKCLTDCAPARNASFKSASDRARQHIRGLQGQAGLALQSNRAAARGVGAELPAQCGRGLLAGERADQQGLEARAGAGELVEAAQGRRVLGLQGAPMLDRRSLGIAADVDEPASRRLGIGAELTGRRRQRARAGGGLHRRGGNGSRQRRGGWRGPGRGRRHERCRRGGLRSPAGRRGRTGQLGQLVGRQHRRPDRRVLQPADRGEVGKVVLQVPGAEIGPADPLGRREIALQAVDQGQILARAAGRVRSLGQRTDQIERLRELILQRQRQGQIVAQRYRGRRDGQPLPIGSTGLVMLAHLVVADAQGVERRDVAGIGRHQLVQEIGRHLRAPDGEHGTGVAILGRRQLRLDGQRPLERPAGVEVAARGQQRVAQAQGSTDIRRVQHGRLVEQADGRLDLAAAQGGIAQADEALRAGTGTLRRRRTRPLARQHGAHGCPAAARERQRQQGQRRGGTGAANWQGHHGLQYQGSLPEYPDEAL